MYLDTIAAISTPPGEGGIGIVRMSGPDSPRIATQIYRRGAGVQQIEESAIESHRLYYGTIVDPATGRQIDEVMLVRMMPPKSYTREEVIEISCHGGLAPVQQTLDLCLRAGARIAEPGEFTLRAFLNGRIDLSQAEAVASIVAAQTSKSLELAMDELRGRLTADLQPARDMLVETLAYLDAAADFPDDEIPDIDLKSALAVARDSLDAVVQSAQAGLLYREGIQIAIVGRPNVGKSSLLNALLGTDRAIVTEIAGTTRDIISESINLHGIPATLLDTAGITETADIVEKIGVERSQQALETSSIVLFVLDRSLPLKPEDFAVARLLEDRLGGTGVVVALNKSDLPAAGELLDQLGRLQPAACIEISAEHGAGIPELMELLYDVAAGQSQTVDQPALVTSRQLDALRRALESVESAQIGLTAGIPLDLLAVDVRIALYAVGEITGEHVSEAVLDEIFSRFCIGK